MIIRTVLLLLLLVAPAYAQVTQLELWSNNGASTLGAGINNSTTTITVAAGHGARFPSPTGSQYFWVTLQESNTVEIVKCTARSTDTLTCTRAQQSTSAASFTTAAAVENRLTKQTLYDLWAGWNYTATPAGTTSTGRVALGNQAELDLGSDISVLMLKESQTQTTDNGIGISNTFIFAPSAATTYSTAAYDSIMAVVPANGTTIAGAMGFNINVQTGAGVANTGTVTDLDSIRIGYPNTDCSACVTDFPTITNLQGIRVLNQRGYATDANTYAMTVWNNNWFGARNAADNAYLRLFALNASNRIEFAQLVANTIAYVNATGNVLTQTELTDGTITRTLPDSATASGVTVHFKNIGLTGNTTIATAGGTLTGVLTIPPGDTRSYLSISSGWYETTQGVEWTVLRTTSDITTTANTTTLNTATGLSFTMGASVEYAVECSLMYTGNTITNGIGVTVDLSGTVTRMVHSVDIGGFAADGAAANWRGVINADVDPVVATDVEIINTAYPITVSGIVRNNAGADNWTLQFRNEVAVASNTVTLLQGSTCQYRALP